MKKSKSPKKNDPQNRGRRPNDPSRIREDVVSCEIDLQYPDETNVEMSTFQNDHIVSGIFFTLDSTTFTFLRDPPVTRSMQLFPKAVVLMGYPLVLTISSEFADGVDCDWYSCLDNEEMTHVGTGEIFYPTDVCVGRRLKAVCTPWRWDTDHTNAVNKNNVGNVLDRDSDSLTNKTNVNNVKDVDGIKRTEEKDDTESESSLSLNDTVLHDRNTINKLQNDSRRRILGRPAVCYSAKKIFQPVSLSEILKVRKDFIELKSAGKEVRMLGDDTRNVPQELNGNDSKSLRNSNHENKNKNKNHKICTNSDFKSSNLLIDSSNLNNRKAEINKSIRGVKELRVMTFNTLAEPFAISNHAMNNIYSYCHIDHLDTEYRAQLTGLELLSYDADVLCLQECDAKTFKSYYYPLLTDKGYDVHYTNKVSCHLIPILIQH